MECFTGIIYLLGLCVAISILLFFCLLLLGAICCTIGATQHCYFIFRVYMDVRHNVAREKLLYFHVFCWNLMKDWFRVFWYGSNLKFLINKERPNESYYPNGWFRPIKKVNNANF
jgi:hypothetical protein